MSDPILELKRELMAAAERQIRHAPAPEQHLRFGGRVVAVRFVLVAATVAVAATVGLFFTAPWSSSPSFLERAEAALTPPEGMILHQKWADTSISSNPKCTVTWTGETWSDGELDPASSKRVGLRYRAVVRDPFLPYPFRSTAQHPFEPPLCSRGSTYEVGGTIGPPPKLSLGLAPHSMIRFVPPDRLVRMPKDVPPPPLGNLVAALRHSIRFEGARDLGKTRRDGRTMERIRFSLGIAYVDPATFYPIELDIFRDPILAGVDLHRLHLGRLPRIVREALETHLRSQLVRFSVYEYLPRTAANVALTNIRAQHPNATGP